MSEKVNPDDFIITRKRKKYRFAKFANAENCFEYDEWLEHKARKSLQDVTLEIGAGTGHFSLELAAKYPEKIFIAFDVKADRLQKGAYEALESGVKNIYFLRARADQINELFEPESLQSIWLTFPDPFPRKSSAGRRMTHANFLSKYANLLGSTGSFYLKHDNTDFFHWSIEQLVQEGWRINNISFDLHGSLLSDDYKILTTYEKRWIGEGAKIKFVKAAYETAAN